MRETKHTTAHAAFYLFAYAGVACMTNYMNVFLETCRGFSGSQLGLFNGLANLATVFFLPFMGVIAHRLHGHRRTLLIFTGITVVALLSMQWQTALPVLIALGCVEGVSKTCALTSADTQISSHCLQNGGNYGGVRSFGSIGYVLGGLTLGFLAANAGLGRLLLPVTAVCFALALGAAAFFPSERALQPVQTAPAALPTRDAFWALIKNPRFRFLIFITLFSAFTLDCNLNYIGNHLVVTLGASEKIISLNTACCVIPEILFLPLVSKKILPRYGYRKLYRFSAVVLVLRCAFYLVVKNPLIFVLGSLLHCVAIGCNPVAALAYAADVTPPALYGTAVAVFSTCVAIGRAAYGYACGWIYQVWGSRAIFAVLLVINLISAVVIFRSKLFEIPERT